MKEQNIKRVNIIGVPISVVNLDTCIEAIFKNFNENRGNYICVSNVHTTVMAHENEEYKLVQSESLLSIPDGKPLSLVGRKQYPSMDRVTGVELMLRIFEESRKQKIRHFFYGNTAENLKMLIDKVRSDYPWVDIVGYEPSVFREMSEMEENQLCERINSVSPDIVWIALGAPKQELFCYRNRNKTKGIMIGVGGAFNVVAGIVPNAPKWMQNLSLEWLFRLLQEPRRLFKRYLVTNTKFIWFLFKEKIL